MGKRITDWSFGTKSGCAMNRPEIIHEMNKFLLILFVLTASILSVALWGLIIITILHSINSFTWYDKALYSLGIISIVLMFFSHAFLYQIMYDNKIYALLIKWIKGHDITPWFVLTMGLCNTYLLDLYYKRNKYSKFDLLQYRVNITDSIIVMLPLINICIYFSIIKSGALKQKISKRDFLHLYVRGRLIQHIIQSNE